ncbi:hypothetical protein ACFSTJ_11845 [Ottowia pentelensis]|uniref:hypothetical protein n=1 Tax=Ottowia pentelensis TaxID=511108 RepID=UPI00363215DF
MSTPPAPARPASAKRAAKAGNPRQLRQQALADVRRERVLDAARAAFFELGMEKPASARSHTGPVTRRARSTATSPARRRCTAPCSANRWRA